MTSAASIEVLPGALPDWAALSVGAGRFSHGGAVAALEPGPRGHCGLSHTENGRTLRLTSAVDPAAEDRALVEKFVFDPSRGVLCLGLGLGYFLEELADRLAPEAPLWVMESRPELAAAALASRDFSRLMARDGFRLFIGPFEGAPPWGPEPAPESCSRPSCCRRRRLWGFRPFTWA